MREDNARKGFFEREQLEGILVLLPFHWRSVVRTAYITGWRMARKFASPGPIPSLSLSGTFILHATSSPSLESNFYQARCLIIMGTEGKANAP